MRPLTLAIVAPPLAGHYDPLGVLADALAARGHRPVFVHMGDARRLVRGAAGFHAIDTAPFGPGALDLYLRRLGRADRALGLLAMIRATAALSRTLLRELPEALGAIGADAVVADMTEPAGALVARHMGLPVVATVTGLPLLREPALPPPFLGWPYRADESARRRNVATYWIVDRLMRPITRTVAEAAEGWGIDPADAAGAPLLHLAQCPPGLDFPRTALPSTFRHCGPFRPAAEPPLDLPDDGRPLVYCSLGSLQGHRHALLARITAACAAAGARAIVGHGGLLSTEQVRGLPGDPLVAAFWPQPRVLPRCAAAIVHGGFNTVLDALAAGVPMVVIPLAFEQPGTAARLAFHGVGRIVPPRASSEHVGAALADILADPAPRAAAAALAGEIARLGGVVFAADLIEQALSAPQSPAAPPATATTPRAA